MVRGYQVYNTDIWASVVGEEFLKMTNSCLVGGMHTRCSVNLAYFHLSNFPQARYRRRLTGIDGSTGVWKAGRRLEIPLQTPSLAHRFHVFDCPFKLTFRLLKFSQLS